jgi:hypothetical protein
MFGAGRPKRPGNPTASVEQKAKNKADAREILVAFTRKRLDSETALEAATASSSSSARSPTSPTGNYPPFLRVPVGSLQRSQRKGLPTLETYSANLARACIV